MHPVVWGGTDQHSNETNIRNRRRTRHLGAIMGFECHPSRGCVGPRRSSKMPGVDGEGCRKQTGCWVKLMRASDLGEGSTCLSMPVIDVMCDENADGGQSRVVCCVCWLDILLLSAEVLLLRMTQLQENALPWFRAYALDRV